MVALRNRVLILRLQKKYLFTKSKALKVEFDHNSVEQQKLPSLISLLEVNKHFLKAPFKN